MRAGPVIPGDLEGRIRAIENCEFACNTGMKVIEIDPAVPMARVATDGKGLLNGFGTIHGGAIFALADQAFGLAANLAGESEVAVSASIKYLAPAKGRIEAVACRVDENEYASVYRVQVCDEAGRLIALFQGTGYKVSPAPRSS